MARWALAGLTVVVCALVPAFADAPLSGAQDDMECPKGEVLMANASQSLDCVGKGSAGLRGQEGWSVVERPWPGPYEAVYGALDELLGVGYWPYAVSFEPVEHRKTILQNCNGQGRIPGVGVITNIGKDGATPLNDESFWPQYSMTFPYSGPAYIGYDYTYVMPDENGNYDNPKYQCPRGQCEGQYLEIQTSGHVEMLNEEAEFVLRATDYLNHPVRHYNVYRMPLPFDNTKPMEILLHFYIYDHKVHEFGSDYGIGMIYPTVHGRGEELLYFYQVSNCVSHMYQTPDLDYVMERKNSLESMLQTRFEMPLDIIRD